MKGIIPELQDLWHRTDPMWWMVRIAFGFFVIATAVCLIALFHQAGGWLAGLVACVLAMTWLEDLL